MINITKISSSPIEDYKIRRISIWDEKLLYEISNLKLAIKNLI